MRLSHAMALFCLVAACDSPSSGNGTPAPRGDTAQADTSNPRGNPDPVDPGPTDPGPSQCHQCQRQRRQLLRARGLGLVHPRRPDPDRPEPRPRHRSRPGYRPRPERRVHRLWRFVLVRQRLLFRRLRLRHWHLQLTAPRRQSNSELFLRPRTASVQAGELVSLRLTEHRPLDTLAFALGIPLTYLGGSVAGRVGSSRPAHPALAYIEKGREASPKYLANECVASLVEHTRALYVRGHRVWTLPTVAVE